MNPVKILVISNYKSTNVMRPEAEIFIGLKKMGFDIEIMTFGDAEYAKRFAEHGIPVHDFHPVKKYDKAETKRIRDVLEAGQYDILQLYNNKSIINGIRAAKGLPVKVVLYRGYTGNINWWDPTAYSKFLHPRVDHIICLADSVKDHIGRNLFFNKKKLKTINKGHNLDWYSNIPPNDLSKFDIDENTFVVTNVANARRMKGTKYLLQATYHIPTDANIKFLIVGSGRDTKEHLKLAQKSPNRDKIIFVGFRLDALQIVKSSDVFLLTSIKGEATTKSVIEAMSLGVAPVITDIPGNKNLVIDGECGLVVPMKNPLKTAEAVMKLYNDRALTAQFAKAAQIQIDTNFNTERSVKEYAEFYREITK